MNLILVASLSTFGLLATVFVLNDSAWTNFLSSFPVPNAATLGPYFIVLSGVVFTISLKKIYRENEDTQANDVTFAMTSLMIAALISLVIAFVYSFSVVNGALESKYFLLLQLLSYLTFYGGGEFFSSLKGLDRSVTQRSASILGTVHEIKIALFEYKNKNHSVTVDPLIERALSDVKRTKSKADLGNLKLSIDRLINEADMTKDQSPEIETLKLLRTSLEVL
jgi:hypothetical protein